MKIAEYTINSAKTFKDREDGIDPKTTDLLHCAIGIVTEVGELVVSDNDGYKDRINLGEEIGDVMWYVANLARKINYSLTMSKIPEADKHVSWYTKQLVIDASELMDHFKRGIYYFKGVDFNYMSAKIDLIIINLRQLSEQLGIDFEQCLQKNIDKLAKRYPGNFFTPEAALNRDLDGERKTLED